MDATNGNLSNIDAGYYQNSGAISGYCWNDTDENGIQDAGESGLSGINVTLLDQNSQAVAQTTTDANGNYSFNQVYSGIYTLQFGPPSNYLITVQNAGNGHNDSDPNPSTGLTNGVSFNPINGNADDIDALLINESK